MSDREGPSGTGGADDDLTLPKATVYKLINGEDVSHAAGSSQH